jgi:uncharacterized protein YqhQ
MKIIIALIALSIVLYGASFAFADHPIAKKIKYFLQKFDGVWSVPLTIAGFWLLGTILVSVFGFAAGTYDIGFFQPLFLAAGIVIGATNFGVIGVYFTLRGIHRFLYGYKHQEGYTVNHAKKYWKQLPITWQFGLSFFVLFYFITAIIFVYIKFI